METEKPDLEAEGEDEKQQPTTEASETEKTDRKRTSSDTEKEDMPAEKRMKVEEKTDEDNSKPDSEAKTEKEDNDNDVENDKEAIDSDDEPLSLKKKKVAEQSEKEASRQAEADDSSSSVHSEDSEKENVNSDLPMDLSTKSSTSGNTQDIIMLSDESDEEISKLNGDRELSLDELKLKRRMIKRLQAELRNEEAKLVLLKKLRQSQLSNQISENNVPNKSQRPPQHSQPPPLIRGNQPPQQQMQARPAHSQPPQLVRGNMAGAGIKGSQGPPPLLPSRVQDQRQMMQNQMQMLQRGGSPANIIPGLRGSQAQAEALRQMQQAQQRVVEETPAQRQAAAKLALRKQLEKTLLQIPPPKPPPPEMNFIPSLASPDFIYLLGLEEAVNFIIDSNLISKGCKSPDEKLICNPFTCIQCSSDFTPVWKREKPGSKNVICEKCVTTNQKKALKQEHTNRLKSAFVKALQQEQEIERMQSQEAKTSSTTPSSSAQSRELREPRDSPSSRNNVSSNYKDSVQETLRQHQNLLQAQAASLRMGQPLGLQAYNPRFPYQIPFARASDIQRQYLLDMIPKGGMPWNT